MDVSKLIGIPYKWQGDDITGVDCYGICIMYHRMFGIELPTIDYLYDDCNEEKKTGHYKDLHLGKVKEFFKISFTKVELKDAMPGDIVVFNFIGLPVHVGVYIDKKFFLHASEGRDSMLTRFNHVMYKKRLHAVWRVNKVKTTQ